MAVGTPPNIVEVSNTHSRVKTTLTSAQWQKQPSSASCEGMEISRQTELPKRADILICLESRPPRFKLSEQLGGLLGIYAETRIGILAAIWEYVKLKNLQDPNEREYINTDAAMKQVCSRYYLSDWHTI